MSESPVYDVAIIGSGPAGYTAALYAARANLAVLMFRGYESVGGQLMLTTDVENYPGFAEGILGPDLMETMEEQQRRFGAEMRATKMSRAWTPAERPFKVYIYGTTMSQRWAVPSSSERRGQRALAGVGEEAETRLRNRGVSACATCDGAFFKGKDLAVVGGGDTALEEAQFLTRYATHVTLIHRRDSLRASKIMQDRAFKNPGDSASSGIRLWKKCRASKR